MNIIKLETSNYNEQPRRGTPIKYDDLVKRNR